MTQEADPAPEMLPHYLDAFIGRERDVAEIATLLATARLLTLTGPGGVGKTRLAIQVAVEHAAQFRDGTFLVDLVGLADPALLPHFVASRCGIVVRGGMAVGDALAARFRRRHLLLILDNCEHLLAATRYLAAHLLAGCPGLHILATSRERLAVPGEVVWTVGPLTLPASVGQASAADVETSESARLFVDRCRSFLPGLALNQANAGVIARICRLVDGLPLALELAAAWNHVISLHDLADRLEDHPLSLLDRGRSHGRGRHQSLRGTLEWSYGMLEAEEQSVLARLGVFPGDFPLSAAIHVGSGGVVADTDVLPILARLVDTSMITVVERSPNTRYRMLMPIRHFALERLADSGSLVDIEKRHRDWYLAFAQQGARDGSIRDRSMDDLELEHDNLRVAIGWSLAHDDPLGAATIVNGMWTFWLLRGHGREGRHWLDAILARLDDPVPLRAHLLWVAGILSRPDAAAAMQFWTESRSLSQSAGDRDGEARVLASMGHLAQVAGNHDQALAYLDESLSLLTTISSGDLAAEARVRNSLSLSMLAIGGSGRALDHAAAARTISSEIGDAFVEGAAIANLGLIAWVGGDQRAARSFLEESLDVRRRIGDLGGTAHVETLLGILAVRQGDIDRASALLHDGLAIRRRLGADDGFPEVFMGLAEVAFARGSHEDAATLAAMATAMWELTGESIWPWDRERFDATVQALRLTLDAEGFARSWEAGIKVTMDPGFLAGGWPDLADIVVTPPGSGDSVGDPGAHETLTHREIDVMRLLALGLTYAQIGDALSISPRTVDAHLRSIFAKLGVHSRGAATRVALQRQIV